MESELIVARNFLMKEILKLAETDSRRCFWKPYCDGENFVVTDGSILLFTPSGNEEKGYYEMFVSKTGKSKVTNFCPVSWDEEFPEWKDVIPNYDKTVCSFEFNVRKKSPSTVSKSIFQLQFLLSTVFPKDYFLSWTYLSMLIKSNFSYKVYITEESTITFKAENPLKETFTILVLPIQAGSAITRFTKDYKDQLLKKWKANKNNGI